MKKIRNIATDPVILICLAILAPAGGYAYHNIPYDPKAFQAVGVLLASYLLIGLLSELWEIQVRRETSAYLDADASRVAAEQHKTERALRGEPRETAPEYGRGEDVHGFVKVRPDSPETAFEYWNKKEIEKIQGKR